MLARGVDSIDFACLDGYDPRNETPKESGKEKQSCNALKATEVRKQSTASATGANTSDHLEKLSASQALAGNRKRAAESDPDKGILTRMIARIKSGAIGDDTCKLLEIGGPRDKDYRRKITVRDMRKLLDCKGEAPTTPVMCVAIWLELLKLQSQDNIRLLHAGHVQEICENHHISLHDDQNLPHVFYSAMLAVALIKLEDDWCAMTFSHSSGDCFWIDPTAGFFESGLIKSLARILVTVCCSLEPTDPTSFVSKSSLLEAKDRCLKLRFENAFMEPFKQDGCCRSALILHLIRYFAQNHTAAEGDSLKFCIKKGDRAYQTYVQLSLLKHIYEDKGIKGLCPEKRLKFQDNCTHP